MTDFKPIKISATKHAGQQGLSYRSDGRIFSTAGWDNATRVYSGKTLKEVAVLKWHKEGCFATAFASIIPELPPVTEEDNDESKSIDTDATSMTVQQKRDEMARSTHWLAVGSKDGKVSLWDIF